MVIIANTTFITALANIEGEQNTGGGSSNMKSSSSYTWSVNQSGYRFVIVDENFKSVSKVVDILFRNINGFSFGKNDANMYTNPRTSLTLSNSKSNWMYTTFDVLISQGVIPSSAKPPQPIVTVTGKATGTGEEFKKWFLRGNNVIKAQNAPIFTPSGSSSKGSGTSAPSKSTSGRKPNNSSSSSSNSSTGASTPEYIYSITYTRIMVSVK